MVVGGRVAAGEAQDGDGAVAEVGGDERGVDGGVEIGGDEGARALAGRVFTSLVARAAGGAVGDEHGVACGQGCCEVEVAVAVEVGDHQASELLADRPGCLRGEVRAPGGAERLVGAVGGDEVEVTIPVEVDLLGGRRVEAERDLRGLAGGEAGPRGRRVDARIAGAGGR